MRPTDSPGPTRRKSTARSSSSSDEDEGSRELTIGGEKSLGQVLGDQTKVVAPDVTVVILKNAGQWVLEEDPQGATEALLKFL